ncbi:hypothetical protein BKA56DRAFT_494106 [Ilyonectria sp. MPI-CAGE-AT-0026]|nr:hypothetical protein BKA56DRAFT_494106 [Ilyonectria sp. MPI-CAGE-AT-0026]
MDELVETTKDIENKYLESSQVKKGLAKWVQGLSVRVLYYGKILDTLSQHHPEYVSLVWGMIKFILMGVINHGNLVVQFSRALTMIADVLPRAKLSAELYRTKDMKDAIASLYAHIILFLKQAIKWYNVGPAGRALTALFKPFELRYKDTVEQIEQCAKTIDDLAGILVKAEVREISVSLHDQSQRMIAMETRLQEMQTRFEASNADLTVAIHVDVGYMKPRIGEMHLKDMLDTMRPNRSPEESLQRHRSIIRRSSTWRSRNQGTLHILQIIGQWITGPQSSLLVLRTQPRAQAQVKEIATEVIGLLRPRTEQVVWYLSTTNIDEGDMACTGEVLRNLAFQLMKLAPDLMSSDSENFSIAKLSASHSEDEWLSLLCWILGHLSSCFVIVEAEDVSKNEGDSGKLMELLGRLEKRFNEMRTVVKLLVVSYNSSWPAEGTSAKVVDVQWEQPVPKRMRKPGPRSIFRGSSWDRVGRPG